MRVNVEDEALIKAELHAAKGGMCKYELIGMLVYLWNKTQCAGIKSITLEELKTFIPFRDSAHVEGFIKACLCSGFLKRNTAHGLDYFTIKGNIVHIEKLTQLRDNAKKGGIAKGKSKRQKRTAEAEGNAQYNAIQSNTIQCSVTTALTRLGEEAFDSYPERLGEQKRQEGLNKLYEKATASGDAEGYLTRVKKAVENYRKYCVKDNAVGTKFVKQFTNWVDDWEEWEHRKIKPDGYREEILL